MRKLLLLLLALSFALSAAPPEKRPKAKRAAGGAKKTPARTASRAARVEGDAQAESAPVMPAANSADFSACMDNWCKSEMFPDKGRCRCSSQLPKIEKVLRDIERAQNEADEMGRKLAVRMNVENTAAVEGAMGSIADNIAGIENKAKTMAAARIDARSNVAEGAALYNYAEDKCTPSLASASEDEQEGRKKEYMTAVEKDCGAYTTILKEKADAVSDLLAQAQKNQEMFNEQEHKKRNMLDLGTCRIEYESCLKMECGLNFHNCRQDHLEDMAIKKCDALNAGKCEDTKAVIMLEMKNYVKREVRKDDLAMNCTVEGASIIEGKCMKDNKPYAAKGWRIDGYPTATDLRGAF
ncbi:MAG: hypothetical protein LBL52_04180 [Rickettsiales bacterium]|jgi:hypothetical protein|nr:hypothetical protein [Rickettsiales bacterium]